MTTLTLRCALRARPYPCRFSTDCETTAGLLLRVKDTTGLIADSFVARCKTPEVLAFVRQHSADLIPGRCIDLQLTRLRAIGDEIRADVLQCSLAPLAPSWQPPTAHPRIDATNIDF